MVRIIKETITSIIIYIWDEDIIADKIVVYSEINENNKKKVGEHLYKTDVIEYKFSDLSKFIDYNVDNFPFSIDFIKDDQVVKTVKTSTTNYRIQPFQRGLYKTKRYEFYIKAKKVNGHKLLVLKKMDKVHCPKCWDEDYQSSNNTNCDLCGGTGFVDKYSEPFFTYGFIFNDQPASSTVTEGGRKPASPSQGSSVIVSLLADVLVGQKDIVYSINTADCILIDNVNVSMFANIELLQKANGYPLPSDSNVFKNVEKKINTKTKEVLGGIR